MFHLKTKLLLIISGVGLCVGFLAIGTAAKTSAAAPTTPTNGITVSPGQLLFTLPAGTPSQSIPLTITNSYNAPVRLSAEFKGIDENAGLLIPTDNVDPALAPALSFSQTDVTLAARSSQVITVQATNLSSLSPGGHYANIVLTQQDIANNPLSVKAALSVNLFVTKPDGALLAVKLTGSASNHWLFHMPTSVTANFTNSGNVLTTPRATVMVLSHNQHSLYAQGVVNQLSVPILPGKSLQTHTALITLSHAWLPQKLQLQIVYHADGQADLTTVSSVFWYIPPVFVLLPLVVVIVLGRFIYWRHQRHKHTVVSITRVPPLGLLRNLQATTKRIVSIVVTDQNKPEVVTVTVKPPNVAKKVVKTKKKPTRKPAKKTASKAKKPKPNPRS